MSFFEGLQVPPPDVVLTLAGAYKEDAAETKVDLCIGAYRSDSGLPAPLPSVQEAERRVINANKYNYEYLPIDGTKDFHKLAAELIFGEGAPVITEGRVATLQAVGGTGALRVGLEFLRKCYSPPDGGLPVVYIPDTTWPNHPNVVRASGLEVKTYRYFHPQDLSLDLEGLLADLRAAPEGSVALLHMCAHNPTGLDPTEEGWRKILAVVKEKNLMVLFDSAYQGFASGDLDRDAAPARLFLSEGVELMVACSFSKNMGLYGVRLGALHVVCRRPELREAVQGHLKSVARPMYSNPPCAGAKIFTTLLSDPELAAQWRKEMAGMPRRITSMRTLLHDKLVANGTPGNWGALLQQIGMFSYTGLKPAHTDLLRTKYHIYMPGSGRVSMSGINEGNVDYLADAIKDVVTTVNGGAAQDK